MKIGHKYYSCAPLYMCRDNGGWSCLYCDGGLCDCTVCGGAEGSLTSECPGVRMTEEQEYLVSKPGTLDFKNGKWFNPKEN